VFAELAAMGPGAHSQGIEVKRLHHGGISKNKNPVGG
jgi:hypothetical protein